jgi:phosphomannomutase
LTPGFDLDKIFNNLKEKYKNHSINTEDGLKIDFENDWVHLRSSNTEPIIRIYAESNSQNVADNIAQKLMKDIQEAGVSNQ